MSDLPMMVGFILRLKSLMEREGIEHWNKFEEEIGMRGATSRWKSGKDKPTPDSLLKIKKRFSVSIDWLLTGEEPCPSIQEFTTESYDARPLAPIEADLLHQIAILVERVAKEEKRQLDSEQQARLITGIYNNCAEDRIKPDSTMVKRYLWILKKSISGE